MLRKWSVMLSRSGCETTSQHAWVCYFSILILSSLISQCQTTQQSREGDDIVGDGGEATTTFVSKNCGTKWQVYTCALFSFSLISLFCPSSFCSFLFSYSSLHSLSYALLCLWQPSSLAGVGQHPNPSRIVFDNFKHWKSLFSSDMQQLATVQVDIDPCRSAVLWAVQQGYKQKLGNFHLKKFAECVVHDFFVFSKSCSILRLTLGKFRNFKVSTTHNYRES